MQLISPTTSRFVLAASVLALGGCTVSDGDEKRLADSGQVTGQSAPAPTPVATSVQPSINSTDSTATLSVSQPGSMMRVEVDLKARMLHLYDGSARVESHPVAVGSAKWPTETGEWTIKQVIFNPEWIPPDESWAEEREPRKSGEPSNPLGKAQLVYDLPRTIHGTNNPSSIGQAVSHGSIRMSNTAIVALAKRIASAGGAPRDAAWFRRAAEQRNEKQVVDLPTPVPIKVF